MNLRTTYRAGVLGADIDFDTQLDAATHVVTALAGCPIWYRGAVDAVHVQPDGGELVERVERYVVGEDGRVARDEKLEAGWRAHQAPARRAPQ